MPKTQVLDRFPHPKYPRLTIQRRNNSRFYQAVTFLDGKRKQTSCKTDHLPTAFKLAEDWYKRELRSSVNFGHQHPLAKLTSDPTIAELFASYSADLETLKRPYAKQKWSPIADFWHARLLSTVSSETFREFYAWRRRRDKVKNHTLHKDVVLIRQVLKSAMDRDLLEHLPRIPSVGSIETNPRPWLTPQELMHLTRTALARVKAAPNVRVKQQRQDLLDMIFFLHASMLRIGEIRSLRFHSCRVEENTDGDKMLLCEVTGKRGTRTAVALSHAAYIYEQRLKTAKSEDLMFPHHSRDAFRELLIAAGLRTDHQGFERNLKSMRATSISTMLLENPDLNLGIVARNAGTSIAMIDSFYAKRLTAEMHKDRLSKLPDALSAKGIAKRERSEARKNRAAAASVIE